MMEQETAEELGRRGVCNEIAYVDLMHGLYRDRIFVMLASNPDLSIKEIARMLPCSESTARTWKYQFHEKRGDNLQGECTFCHAPMRSTRRKFCIECKKKQQRNRQREKKRRQRERQRERQRYWKQEEAIV